MSVTIQIYWCRNSFAGVIEAVFMCWHDTAMGQKTSRSPHHSPHPLLCAQAASCSWAQQWHLPPVPLPSTFALMLRIRKCQWELAGSGGVLFLAALRARRLLLASSPPHVFPVVFQTSSAGLSQRIRAGAFSWGFVWPGLWEWLKCRRMRHNFPPQSPRMLKSIQLSFVKTGLFLHASPRCPNL